MKVVFQPLSQEQEVRDLFINNKTYPPIVNGVFHVSVTKEDILKYVEMDFDSLLESPTFTVFEMSLRVKRLNR